MFERVCLSVYVCMPQTYIHKPNIHTQLVDLPYRKAFQEALERVCMFENPLPVMENCFKHTYMHAQKQVCVATKNPPEAPPKSVCMFQIPQPVMEMKHQRSNIHSQISSKIKPSEPLEHACMFEIPLPVMEERSNIHVQQLSSFTNVEF